MNILIKRIKAEMDYMYQKNEAHSTRDITRLREQRGRGQGGTGPRGCMEQKTLKRGPEIRGLGRGLDLF